MNGRLRDAGDQDTYLHTTTFRLTVTMMKSMPLLTLDAQLKRRRCLTELVQKMCKMVLVAILLRVDGMPRKAKLHGI